MIEIKDILEVLKEKKYPGRGIIAGRTEKGERFAAYFIMGRSENSRNRVMLKDEGVRTAAADASKMKDPSLVIYNAMKCVEGYRVITNGAQTDTICDFIAKGKSFQAALESWDFEPDPPIYTPRISLVIKPKIGYEMAILKRENNGETLRVFWDFEEKEGVGRFIHTYEEGETPTAFATEPLEVSLKGDCLKEGLWKSLDNDNKISLFTVFGSEVTIFNKYEVIGL